MNFSLDVLEKLRENPVSVLNRGYRAKERIAARRERIESWREIAESITANPENSSGGSGPSNKVENCVVRIVTLEDEITEEIAKIAGMESENAKIIEFFVEDPNYKAVLELRYLSYKRFEEISVALGYTFRWTQELHKRAMNVLKKRAAEELDAEGKNAAAGTA